MDVGSVMQKKRYENSENSFSKHFPTVEKNGMLSRSNGFYQTSFHNAELLSSLREEFQTRFKEVQASPHLGKCAYKFEELPLLGKGKFGTVHLLRGYPKLKCVALKVVKKENVVRHKAVELVVTEKKLLDAAKFPFISTLIFSCKDNDFIYFGLPFAGGGDFFNFHRKRQKFTETIARFYAAQVILAIEYLHNIKCLYRDLKLENILLDSTGYIRLTDFGLSKFVEDRTVTLCGTPEYLAPEMILLKPYGTSVDWWTFGILLYEFVAGNTPFAKYNTSLVEMYSKICEASYDMPNNFSPELKDFILRILNPNNAVRLGCMCNGSNDIRSHKFFRPANFGAILKQEIVPPHKPQLLYPCDVVHFRKGEQKIDPPIRSKSDQYTKNFEHF